MFVEGSDRTLSGEVAVVANPAGPENESDRSRIPCFVERRRLETSGGVISNTTELAAEACGGDDESDMATES